LKHFIYPFTLPSHARIQIGNVSYNPHATILLTFTFRIVLRIRDYRRDKTILINIPQNCFRL